MKVITANSLLSETFLEELMNVTEFIKNDSPIEDGEKTLGKMNTLEKACYALRHNTANEIEKVSEEALSIVKSDSFDLESKSLRKKLIQFKRKVESLKRKHEIFDSIMWHSVHTRFSDEYNFGLRADDTIVSTKAKEPSLLDILEEMGMMGGIGIHVMRG